MNARRQRPQLNDDQLPSAVGNAGKIHRTYAWVTA